MGEYRDRNHRSALTIARLNWERKAAAFLLDMTNEAKKRAERQARRRYDELLDMATAAGAGKLSGPPRQARDVH